MSEDSSHVVQVNEHHPELNMRSVLLFHSDNFLFVTEFCVHVQTIRLKEVEKLQVSWKTKILETE